MALTIGNWIFIGIVFITGLGITIVVASEGSTGEAVASAFITIMVCTALMFGLSWYHKNTASGTRSYKDFESNLQNGLEREITITAEDGREIFHYEGKVDIETSHEGNANYILFESEEGQRYVIYYGIQDTVLIIEKAK